MYLKVGAGSGTRERRKSGGLGGLEIVPKETAKNCPALPQLPTFHPSTNLTPHTSHLTPENFRLTHNGRSSSSSPYRGSANGAPSQTCRLLRRYILPHFFPRPPSRHQSALTLSFLTVCSLPPEVLQAPGPNRFGMEDAPAKDNRLMHHA